MKGAMELINSENSKRKPRQGIETNFNNSVNKRKAGVRNIKNKDHKKTTPPHQAVKTNKNMLGES